ncbi:MAG TPA: hypothetical protein VFX59_16310 [Polyangiales bacterium]|nr:hypothetical protein [Polyangiales bacterium]
MTKLPRSPEAVIFDVDGLLIDTVPLYAAAMVEAAQDQGARPQRESLPRPRGYAREDRVSMGKRLIADS